jgi:hypothetical protein
MGYGPITHFTDIETWKLARKMRAAGQIIRDLVGFSPCDSAEGSWRLEDGKRKIKRTHYRP